MHSKQNLPKYTFPFFNFSFSKHVICCLKTAFTIFSTVIGTSCVRSLRLSRIVQVLLAFPRIQNRMKRIHFKVICILKCVFSVGCLPIHVFMKDNLQPGKDILVGQQYHILDRIWKYTF